MTDREMLEMLVEGQKQIFLRLDGVDSRLDGVDSRLDTIVVLLQAKGIIPQIQESIHV